MAEELSEKEKLLRLIKKMGRKRKVQVSNEPKLTIEGGDAKLFIEGELSSYSKGREETDKLRNVFRKIVKI